MKKDNRIIRPELLTTEELEGFAPAINNYIDDQFKRYKDFLEKQTAERNRKIASGEYIVRDGKVYDARFYKGA